MKEIGRTNDGNVLVELTHKEREVLGKLQETWAGRGLIGDVPYLRDNLDDAFVAILVYSASLEVANDVVDIANRLRDMLHKQE